MDPLHWSHLVSETTLSFSPDCSPGVCPLSISGGSEYGDFCLVGNEIKHNKLIYHSGPASKLRPDDIILEVQGQKVAGFTSSDLSEHILKAARNSNPVLIKTAKSGTLRKELRPYLNYGFPKGSVDHDTQMTIRENLFQRTVPCTTRPARDGEVNGVDYTFVSSEEFKALEKSGNLLESGEFDGNFYGMPKPPIVSVTEKRETNPSDMRPGAHPSSKGKRQRNRSTIEATSNKNLPIDNTVHSAHIPGTDIIMPAPSRGPSRGPTDKSHVDRPTPEKGHSENLEKQQLAPPSPSHMPTSQPPLLAGEADGNLPTNWETAYTAEGHMYFIDHNTETTHWTHPKQKQTQATPNKFPTPQPDPSPTEELPYGWEKVDDPHYGTYYIDHLSRKTQYDAPTKSTTGSNHELISPSPSAKSARSVPSYREPDSVSQQHSKPFFTKKPDELSGEALVTCLTKSTRGFGFTIVGGDERDEEFLQIKNVVPHGPADQDGVLRTGDVLVRVNEQLVLGFTHSDVVSMFQTIKPGERVSLHVCRGYQLAFDPNDPNTEIVTTIAVSMPKLTPAEAKQREVERAKNDDDDADSLDEFADSLLHVDTMNDQPRSPNHRLSSSEFPQSGQMFSIEIVRGHNGFGFTIADGANGQRVKHILDPGRCKTLQEGDILVKIAGTEVKNMDHLDVVDVLKRCQQGCPTEIVVQRTGARKVARPPSQSRSQEESNGMFKWTVNGSTGQLPRSNLQSTSSLGNRDDDSEGQRTPPPLPSKGRLNSDTTADSKENLLAALATSSLTEAPSSMVLPSQLRDSTNLLTNRSEDVGRPVSSVHSANVRTPLSGMLPIKQQQQQQQPISKHPVMNQYNPYYQPQKESFYDIPNKYRTDNTPLTAQQRFDMLNGPAKSDFKRPHEFGQPLDSTSRAHPQVLPSFPPNNTSQNYQPLDNRRSRTPGPEHMRPPPDRPTDDRFRSKTPNPSDHRSRAHSLQNNLNQPPSISSTGVTSFENSTPSAGEFGVQAGWKEQWLTLDISLRKGDQGFGFRIVGGPEESTQVAIGYIVPDGVADQDRRLKTGDEIIRVDSRGTLGESHHIVVALMGQAASNGQVNIGIRRRVLVQDTSAVKTSLLSNSTSDKPYDVIVTRREHEGFGFIIVSSVNRVGAVVGRIIENSPAERCGRLRVGDRILAVNDVHITRMLHEDIVNLIKDSGYSVKLVVAPPPSSPSPGQDKRPNGSLTSATALPSMADNETLVRNMHSHTALGTADRYNGGPVPLQNSKSAGNLSGNQPSQTYGTRSDSRLPSSSSGTAPYDLNQPSYQPPPRPVSAYEPTRPAAYDPLPVRSVYDPVSARQNTYEPARPSYEAPRPSYEAPRPSYEAPRPNYEPPRPSYEPPRSTGYDPSKLGVRTPLLGVANRPTANNAMPSAAPSLQNSQPSPGSILSIELMRSSRGFGFSIRGGREFNNMPLYVLRIAEDGAAHMDQRLLVGDEILEINEQRTTGMSHADAINLIQSGGSKVKLLIKRTGQLPNISSDQGIPSPQGSGLSSPAIRNAAPNTLPPATNMPTQQPQNMGYDPNQNYSKERYGIPVRQDSQMDHPDSKYIGQPSAGYRDEPPRSSGVGVIRGPSMTSRGPDTSRSSAYQSDRYNPANTNNRYQQEPVGPPQQQQQQQRGYPVGRDNVQNSDRPMSNSYPPPPHQHTNVNNRPYTNSNVSNKTAHYNGPSISSSYQQAPVSTPPYNTSSHTSSYQPPAEATSYSNNNSRAGYQAPQPAGSYNAGAMNRQMNQQMYNYYDRNKPVTQPAERQPPVGQNSFDNRGSTAQSNYPNSYGARYNAPSNYKPMDYGAQGMIRSNNTTLASNAQPMYSGQANGGVVRPHTNYNDQPINTNYYTRQPAYQ